MTEYLYRGPLTGITLPDGTEMILYPGREVSLPGDGGNNPYLQTLITLGYLKSTA
jgi:hypothetical protein